VADPFFKTPVLMISLAKCIAPKSKTAHPLRGEMLAIVDHDFGNADFAGPVSACKTVWPFAAFLGFEELRLIENLGSTCSRSTKSVMSMEWVDSIRTRSHRPSSTYRPFSHRSLSRFDRPHFLESRRPPSCIY
jgi:hypothetical protein